MSSAFLNIVKRKLDATAVEPDRYALAVYDADAEYAPPPPDAFSLITLRATLHHILHPAAFIRKMATLLVPGGALVFHEPCWEGFVILGLLSLDFRMHLDMGYNNRLFRIISRLRSPQAWRFGRIAENVQQTMLWSARQDVDKSTMEDKHIFRQERLLQIGRECGLDVEFIANSEINLFADGATKPKKGFYREFTVAYLRHCMSLDENYINAFMEYCSPHFDYIDTCSGEDNSPVYHGIFIFRRLKR